MKHYDERVIKEVDQILSEREYVLVGKEGSFSIVNKITHFHCLVDDEDVAELLVDKLKAESEVFENSSELEKKYPQQFIKPMFWPDDRPWPPERR